ncbi:MAG: hypothetical protein AAB818_03005 [Patescibacteria group bacterium]
MFKKKNGIKKQVMSGFSLLEAIVGISIFSVFIFSVMLASQLSQKTASESVRNIQTSFLLEEGVDAIKILRNTSWSANVANLTIGTNYYFNYNGTTWASSLANVYVDGIFERKFVLNNVYRDANDDISSSGTLDAGTKKATVSVSWLGRSGTTTKDAVFYLTNLFSN